MATAIPSVNECEITTKESEALDKTTVDDGTDHPLAFDQHSRWTGFFRDNELLKQIENDVRRLRPEIDFFQRQISLPMYNIPENLRLSRRLNKTSFSSNKCAVQVDALANKSFIPDYLSTSHASASRRSRTSLSSKKNSTNDHRMENYEKDDVTDTDVDEREKHWEVVERILFIYSKVNTAVKYVQGIHEILGPIYFVLATDNDREWSMHAEADSFFCFHNLMVELQDIFIRKMDKESCGIAAALAHFCAILNDNDPVLYRHLEQQQMKPEYYGFRWISLLLSQEFSLPDVIAIWDTVFCSPAGKRMLSIEYICLAMLEMLRDQLLDGDFQNNLKLLQNFPEHIDVSHLVIRSLEIFNGLTWQVKQQQQNDLQKRNRRSPFVKFTSSNGANNNDSSSKRIWDPSTIKARITMPLRDLVADAAAKFQRSNGNNKANQQSGNSTKEEQLLRNATL